MWKRLREFWLFIDRRSLGLFRLTLGCVLIGDWIDRWPDLVAFYTAEGVLPPDAPWPRLHGEFHLSLLDLVQSPAAVRAVFLFGLLCYACLLVGYRTKLFHALSLLFLVSLLSRNPFTQHGGDSVLVAMLTWSLFLPLGARFSLDAARAARGQRDEATLASDADSYGPSLAAFAIVFQFALIYFITAWDKHGPSWRDGTALYYALKIDQFATPLGQWLAEASPLWVIRLLTWGTLVIEYAAMPLMLLPWGQPTLRRIAIVALFAFHLGVWLTMELSSFSWVMIACLPLLLRSEDWALLSRWARRTTAARESPSSVSTRYPRPRLAADVVVAVLLAAVLVDSFINSVPARLHRPRLAAPAPVAAITDTLCLVNNWHLFAPDPIRNDGWWVIDGVTEDGPRVDPLTGREPTFAKPPDLAARYDSHWRKLLYRMQTPRWEKYRPYFARYVTRRNHRSEPAGRRLVRFDFYYVRELTPPRGVDPASSAEFQPTRVHLWHEECFGP